ncbi:GIY-YIG nuclease family protein [Aureibacillus halotolerans]|uniref:Putative endonuclease n=1 Tax=Aureibacillus halotolerans TaxID=1508390 RepID=A0A4R6TUR1_9BACI|nr:GIY-YIG nuclease family protein [Aureibacillus halotolerans]TDQ34246.1 putative endonuclease [Aureibacillus halotolerans]
MESRVHYVYIIECKDGTLYTGYATNVDERLRTHASGKGARYTRGRGPFQLRYQEAFVTKSDAMKKEWQLKSLSKTQKWAHIRRYEEEVKNGGAESKGDIVFGGNADR